MGPTENLEILDPEPPVSKKSCIRSYETSMFETVDETDYAWKAAGGGWWKLLKPL